MKFGPARICAYRVRRVTDGLEAPRDGSSAALREWPRAVPVQAAKRHTVRRGGAVSAASGLERSRFRGLGALLFGHEMRLDIARGNTEAVNHLGAWQFWPPSCDVLCRYARCAVWLVRGSCLAASMVELYHQALEADPGYHDRVTTWVRHWKAGRVSGKVNRPQRRERASAGRLRRGSYIIMVGAPQTRKCYRVLVSSTEKGYVVTGHRLPASPFCDFIHRAFSVGDVGGPGG